MSGSGNECLTMTCFPWEIIVVEASGAFMKERNEVKELTSPIVETLVARELVVIRLLQR